MQPIERDNRPQSLEDVERSLRRITDRLTWKRILLFAALFIWLFNAYAALPYVDGRLYIAVWIVACIGCWTASGWPLFQRHQPDDRQPHLSGEHHQPGLAEMLSVTGPRLRRRVDEPSRRQSRR